MSEHLAGQRKPMSVDFVVPIYFAHWMMQLGETPAVEVWMREDAKGPFGGCIEFHEPEPGVVTFKITEVANPNTLVLGGYLDGIERIVVP